MTLEGIREALDEALPLRMPVFAPGDSGRKKAAELEDYMLKIAHVSGNLCEARHWLRALRAHLAEEWEKLTGWEIATGGKPRARLTAADINRAKIQQNPTKYEAGREAKRLEESVSEQIARFEREDRTCSRAYTFISGK